MRGQGVKSVIAENIHAALPSVNVRNSMAIRKKMCWRCQQEKSPIDGHIRTFKGGPMKFICKECLDKKAAQGAKGQP